jgi:septum formation protein
MRANLLRQMGIDPKIVPSGFDERSISLSRPSTYVKRLATMKARSVAKSYKDGIIIGADSVVSVGNKIIGKPADSSDAISTLRFLSGKVHKVTTGVCIIDAATGASQSCSATTYVKLRSLSKSMISWYVGTGEPMGKAGSYGIQGKGAILVEWIRGDYYNITGLPLAVLFKMLERMGESVLK